MVNWRRMCRLIHQKLYSKLQIVLVALTLLAPGFARAQIPSPPRDLKDYPEYVNSGQVEDAVHIPDAKVVTADYELIRRDFPQTRPLSDAQIDRWLIQEGAFISKTQVRLGVGRQTNSPISASGHFKVVFRPSDYVRAFIIETQGGLFDIKGSGGRNDIALVSHRTGLLETAEALREFAFTKATRQALSVQKSEFGVVDAYAVIDWGFDMVDVGNGQSYSAGAILRQAHFRDNTNTFGLLTRDKAREVENLLRRFGITGTYKTLNDKRINVEYDVLNVQGTIEGNYIFDFGHFRIRNQFDLPTISLTEMHMPKGSLPTDRKIIFEGSKFKTFSPLFKDWTSEDESFDVLRNSGEEKIWKTCRAIAKKFKESGRLPVAVQTDVSKLLEPIQKVSKEYVLNNMDCDGVASGLVAAVLTPIKR